MQTIRVTAFANAIGFVVPLILSLCVACGGGTTSGSDARVSGDMTKVRDMTFVSACGHPGDKGNSLGVGRFCQALSDCEGTPHPTLCTILGSSDNFFCTFMCKPGDAGLTECGENARCACEGNQCGCFPTACD